MTAKEQKLAIERIALKRARRLDLMEKGMSFELACVVVNHETLNKQI